MLETFLQPVPFYTAHNDIAVLVPNREMSIEEKMWWALCIRANKYRYNYGRQANRTLAHLVLPAEVPAWVKVAAADEAARAIEGLVAAYVPFLSREQLGAVLLALAPVAAPPANA